REEGMHQFGAKERELLRYAAYLHDIGDFISFSNHHQHSYYIVRNAELLGFDQREIEIMASLAKFHRKKSLGKRSSELEGLEASAQKVVVTLSPFLRIAEALDRSHCGLIDHARFINANEEEAVLEISARGDCQLELWGTESQGKGFRKAFGRDLRIRFKISTALDEAR
ncbi:MAG TPA: HD domain-containing protein, partial [Methanomassiliicoccales archaeon]|nr:HD domain-containing protein [Methanomassiliicoccales archaeon]